MKELKTIWEKEHGYSPDDEEVLYAWRSGTLLLTDEQENDLLKHFDI